MRFAPLPIAMPALSRSSGVDTAAAAVTKRDASLLFLPSQLRSTLPPTETPTA